MNDKEKDFAYFVIKSENGELRIIYASKFYPLFDIEGNPEVISEPLNTWHLAMRLKKELENETL